MNQIRTTGGVAGHTKNKCQVIIIYKSLIFLENQPYKSPIHGGPGEEEPGDTPRAPASENSLWTLFQSIHKISEGT